MTRKIHIILQIDFIYKNVILANFHKPLFLIILIASPIVSSIASSTVYICAIVLKANISPARIWFPGSQFRGLSALGFANKLTIARHKLSNVHAGE